MSPSKSKTRARIFTAICGSPWPPWGPRRTNIRSWGRTPSRGDLGDVRWVHPEVLAEEERDRSVIAHVADRVVEGCGVGRSERQRARIQLAGSQLTSHSEGGIV